MKQANIGVFVVLALASTSLVARPQAKDLKGPAIGKTQRSPRLRQVGNYQTMLNMTFPEFAAATAKTDILLLSIGSIEEHGPNLPLATDSIVGVAQLIDVQHYLRIAKIETIVGPPLNIGITNEAGDHSRDGTYMYPGSLTVGADTFVRLYVDLLQSLHDNGLRRVFLVSGHLGGRHLIAMARIAEEASRQIEGMNVYALIDSERAEQLRLKPSSTLVLIERGQNFPMLAQLLGPGKEPAASTHADGCEVSLMLHYHQRWCGPDTASYPRRRPLDSLRQLQLAMRPRIPPAWEGFLLTKHPPRLAKK